MFVLAKQNSIANVYLKELRDKQIQKDSLRFRRNLERIGEILAYEISKTLHYKPIKTNTVLGKADCKDLIQPVVLGTVMRAGLPFHNGFLNIFDQAENTFVASYRNVIREDGYFEIKTEYLVSPDLENKILILADPMLATGQSLYLAWEALTEKYGIPAHTHIASVIASKEGTNFVKKNMKDISLWLGDLDEELNSKAYIVPGLGDAGDLSFGPKL